MTRPDQITLPLDAYELSLRETVVVERAEHKIAMECMKTFGLEVNVPFHERDTSGPDLRHNRRYGLLDPKHAEAFGYHPKPASSSLREPATREGPDLTETEIAVLGGVVPGQGQPSSHDGRPIPEGGCFGEARRALMGGKEFDPSLPERLKAESFHRSETDSRVLAAYTRWSDCMSRAGFEYRSSRDANNDERWAKDPMSEAEIAVAVADVRCKFDTNLAGVRMAVEAAYQRWLIEENAERLQAVKIGNEHRLRNASRILAGRG